MSAPLSHVGAAVLCKDVDFASKDYLGARSTQEDYALFSTNGSGSELLAVLADGMGGHSGGEIASKKAVDAFHATFNAYPSGPAPVKLGASLNQANTDLAISIENSPALNGMGCTLIGAHIGSQGLQWISVGDSLLLLYRKGKLSRLNADHSMNPLIEESMRLGKLTKEEALRHPDRHALRSAVTGEELAMIDTSVAPIGLHKGDVVIVASDGLLTLSYAEIGQVIRGCSKANAQVLATTLVEAVIAKQKSRQDNTTIQIFIAPVTLGASSAPSVTLWALMGCLVVALAIAFTMPWTEGVFKWAAITDLFEKREVSPTPPKPMPTPVVTDTPPQPSLPTAVAPALQVMLDFLDGSARGIIRP